MARVISKGVAEIRHSNSDLPMKRQQLRLFSLYVFGTFHDLTKNISQGAPASAEERDFVKKVKMIERDLHTQLASVGCDVGEG
ncbi:TPA: hypothetical protein IB149_002964 [Escherichia coli]|nr:hypothetical protein [Escherichia coli]